MAYTVVASLKMVPALGSFDCQGVADSGSASGVCSVGCRVWAEGVEGFGRLGFRDLPASSTEVLKRSLDRTLLNDSDGRAPSSRAGSSAEELGWEVQLSDTVAARRIPYGSMYCTVWAYASQGVPI